MCEQRKVKPLHNSPSIRAAENHDVAAIKDIAIQTGLFSPDEADTLEGMLGEYFADALPQHQWLVASSADKVIGAAYVAPELLTDGTWNLYFIGVLPDMQGRGLGAMLLQAVEERLRQCSARVLIIETSGLDNFELTRRFYRKHGYAEEARIREFYRAGDDKIVFWKKLTR